MASMAGKQQRSRFVLLLFISLVVASSSRSYYDVLEVPKGASSAEIKKSYRQLALKWHPDKSREPEAAAMFRELAEAYEVLGNPGRRKQYDAGDGLQFDSSDFVFRDAEDIFKEFFGDSDPFAAFDQVFADTDREMSRIFADVERMETSAAEQAGGIFSMVSSFFASMSGGGQQKAADMKATEAASDASLGSGSVDAAADSGQGEAGETCAAAGNCEGEAAPASTAEATATTTPATVGAAAEAQATLPRGSPFAPGVDPTAVPKDSGPGAKLTAAAAAGADMAHGATARGTAGHDSAGSDGSVPSFHNFGQQQAGSSPFSSGSDADRGASDECAGVDFQTGREPVDTAVKHTSGSACCNPSPQAQPTDRFGCCRRCQGEPACEVFVFSPTDGSCWLLRWVVDSRPTVEASDRVMGVRLGMGEGTK